MIKYQLPVFLLLSLFINLSSCKTHKASQPIAKQAIGVITGIISYTEETETPTPFWAEVELCEINALGKAGKLVAKMMVESPQQMPITYRLIVDSNKIDKAKKYGLVARIFIDKDRLMWQNALPKPALNGVNNSHIDIIVTRTSKNI